jgi:ERCC4-type nuclease
MLIKIDYRETDLFSKLTTLNQHADITLQSANLPLGDIIICTDDGLEKVMIERKTLKDLAASIRDGRYKEQGFRLNACDVPNHNIFYLLEGNLQTYKPFHKGAVDKYALLSSMVSITYYKGFSLYRANTLEESAEWLLQVAYKIGKEGGNPFYMTPSVNIDANNLENSVVDDSYSNILKRTKKNNITPENIGEIMLSQIPNVSTGVAITIMEKYKTLKNLMEVLSVDKNALDSIKTVNKVGQSRKINKTTIENIYTYLMAITPLAIETK